MTRRSLVRVSLLLAGFLLAGAGTALAYWAVTVLYGSGNYALAQASSLSAPTTPGATANGSGAITISWSLPSSQLAIAQYQFTRTIGRGSLS
jgi:hypothetical protein